MTGNTAKSIHEDTGEKNVYSKVHIPNLFYGDRKKFEAYCNQIRFFIWNDNNVRPQVPPRSHVIVLVEGPAQKGSPTLDSESSVYYLYTTYSTIELSLLLRLT